ncbi:MAG: LCP family protein [Eubacteriaceae bacterium]
MRKNKFSNEDLININNNDDTGSFNAGNNYINESDDVDIYNYGSYNKVPVVKRRWFKVIVSIIASLLIIGIVGFGYINKIAVDKSSITRTDDKFLNKVNVSKGLNAAENFDKNVVNILVFGIDRNEARTESGDYSDIYRPDTIILVSLNIQTKAVSMVSLPRDTYVPLYGNRGKTKINACMYYGSIYGNKGNDFDNGVDCLTQTVSALLGGVPIDYYVCIDMDTVIDIVDAVGGVQYDVPYNIRVKNTIKIKKGPQLLDGYHFLLFARDRNAAGSDIERAGMQQKLLKTLFDQVKKGNKLMLLPKIYNSIKDNIYTNMSFEQLTSLAATAKDIDVNNIKTYTFPGYYGSRDGVSYWIINQAQRVALIKQVYGITAAQWTQEPLRTDSRTTTTTTTTTTTPDESSESPSE